MVILSKCTKKLWSKFLNSFLIDAWLSPFLALKVLENQLCWTFCLGAILQQVKVDVPEEFMELSSE